MDHHFLFFHTMDIIISTRRLIKTQLHMASMLTVIFKKRITNFILAHGIYRVPHTGGIAEEVMLNVNFNFLYVCGDDLLIAIDSPSSLFAYFPSTNTFVNVSPGEVLSDHPVDSNNCFFSTSNAIYRWNSTSNQMVVVTSAENVVRIFSYLF
jgi:hypothetical protein